MNVSLCILPHLHNRCPCWGNVIVSAKLQCHLCYRDSYRSIAFVFSITVGWAGVIRWVGVSVSDMAVLCPCSQPWSCHPCCTCICRSFERIGDSDFLEGQGPQGGGYSQLTAIITVGNDQSFPTRGKANFLAGALFLAWFQESLLTASFRQEDRLKQ